MSVLAQKPSLRELHRQLLTMLDELTTHYSENVSPSWNWDACLQRSSLMSGGYNLFKCIHKCLDRQAVLTDLLQILCSLFNVIVALMSKLRNPTTNITCYCVWYQHQHQPRCHRQYPIQNMTLSGHTTAHTSPGSFSNLQFANIYFTRPGRSFRYSTIR